jgi:hypothetical protein
MPNVYEFLSFDALPAAGISEHDDKLTITAPAIAELDEGQEVVFFIRTPLGHGIAIYVALQRTDLKQPMVIMIDKSQLPKARQLHIDYGAYVNRRAVHRSAVAYYPDPEDAAQG